jgi:hypothetical protein
MVSKRAKILSPDHVEDLMVFARQTRHPIRNQVLVLLSVKAGLRANASSNARILSCRSCKKAFASCSC